MPNRQLKKQYGRYSLLLVAVLFARALIPVGYMLTLPDDEQSGFALHLCPVQNRQIDLGLLAGSEAQHRHHHVGTDSGQSGATGNDEGFTLSAECRSWLNSATFAVDFAEAASNWQQWVAIRPMNRRDVFADQLSVLSAQARAPPLFIKA